MFECVREMYKLGTLWEKIQQKQCMECYWTLSGLSHDALCTYTTSMLGRRIMTCNWFWRKLCRLTEILARYLSAGTGGNHETPQSGQLGGPTKIQIQDLTNRSAECYSCANPFGYHKENIFYSIVEGVFIKKLMWPLNQNSENKDSRMWLIRSLQVTEKTPKNQQRIN
jgi:hypothetical protein